MVVILSSMCEFSLPYSQLWIIITTTTTTTTTTTKETW
jgi:hypothetical protein